MTRPNDAEGFWAQVAVREPDECWPWLGGRMRLGYGRLRWQGRKRLAHRVAWSLAYGPVTDDLDVLHRCDWPPCVNPAHLWIGTHADNMRDMAQKKRGTKRRGTAINTARVAPDVVRLIRKRYESGETQKAIARSLGVYQSLVSRVVRRDTWRWVRGGR